MTNEYSKYSKYNGNQTTFNDQTGQYPLYETVIHPTGGKGGGFDMSRVYKKEEDFRQYEVE